MKHGTRLALVLSLLLVGSFPATAGPAGRAAPQWRRLAPVPTARTEAAAAALGSDIYVIGGFVPGGATVPVVEIYDTESDTWRTGPPLVLPVNHAAVASVGGRLYVFGGYLGPAYGGPLEPLSAPTDRAFVLAGDSWEPVAPLPEARGAGGAAVVRSKVFVVGGMGPNGLATETLVYDPRADAWDTRPGLPEARQHLGVAATRSRVIAAGGRFDLLDTNRSTTHAFDGDRWEPARPLRTPRGGLGAAGTEHGYVVAAGGEWIGGSFPVAEAYDCARDRWLPLPPLPTPRHGLGVVAVGTTVYALAGGPDPGYSYSDANEAIDLASLPPRSC